MKKIYFTRHGQTIWNVENKICGATDIALTELGHEQAMELGRKIREQGLKIDGHVHPAVSLQCAAAGPAGQHAGVEYCVPTSIKNRQIEV